MFSHLSCTTLDMTSSCPSVAGQLAIDTDIPSSGTTHDLWCRAWCTLLMHPLHIFFCPQKVANSSGPGLSPSQDPHQAWIMLHHLRTPTISGAMGQFCLANCLSQSISQIWRKLCPSIWAGYGLWYACLRLLFRLKEFLEI